MDTKLKSNNKSFKINIIAIIVLVITSIIIINLYPLIKEAGEGNPYSPYENYDLLNGINKSSYILYKDILEKQNHKELTYDEVYIKSSKYKESGKYEDYVKYTDFKNSLNNQLEDWNEYFGRSLKNLDYLAYSDNISEGKTNTGNKLSELVDTTDNKELNDIYDFYMVVHYNENSELEVTNIHGSDPYTVRNIFSEFSFRRSFSNNKVNESGIAFNQIKNTTFIYAIPKDLKYKDNISVIVNDMLNNVNIPVLIAIVLIILFSALILGLMVPYKLGKEVFGIKVFSEIPLEFNCIIFAIGAWCSGIGAFYSVVSTMQGRFGEEFIKFNTNTQLQTWLINLMNVVIWILILYAIFAGDMLLKYIFNTGLIKYLKEKMIIIKLLKIAKKIVNNINRNMNKIKKHILNIDLTDKSNKFIFKVLGINFIFLSIFCVAWIFGIFLSIAYSVILFIVIRKYLEDIKNKFKILLNAVNKIADGNLDVEIDQDLGLFNPFKEQVEKIQKGFKKAVEEEVKSQRMKTDLISNVSHDLKTPLTSIITYVDLLKGENVTEEERKAYIDTLDKKSQRLKFLIEDLFEVSKATSGNIKLNLINVDIIELIKQTEIELDDKIQKADLTIRNNFPGNRVNLKLDSQKTFRIFENLLNNVAKYAMEGTRVYIDIIENEKNIEITIKNMSAEEISFNAYDIVERFQRGDKSRNTEGSGLGLAIAKSFVEAQEGTFNIEVDGDLFKVIITFKK